MCGRYLVITEDEIIEMKAILEELNQRFSGMDASGTDFSAANAEEALPAALLQDNAQEVVPSLTAPVLVFQEDRVRLQPMTWGFSRWDNKGRIINARSERIAEKAFFRDSFLHHRCIVPSRGFFEWKHSDSGLVLPSDTANTPAAQLSMFPTPGPDFPPSISGKNPVKEKFLIRRTDSAIFYMAGIFQEKGDVQEFVILTMPANIQVAPIHDRMPVFLEKPQIFSWLQDPDTLSGLLENRSASLPFSVSRVNS